MNMDQLRYFLSVARHRNFTEAARAFYVTQPAITHQISALERELGVKLFLRTTRSVSLTRAGELFLEDAKRMLDLEERAQKRMRQAEQTENLELKIGYLNSPCRHFLPQLMREYRSLYPQVRIDLIRGVAEDLQKGCEEMIFDLAFSVLSDLQGLNQYHCRRLVADFYCLVCPPDHSCLDNTSIDYSRLATEPFVCLSREGGSYMYKQFQQICRILICLLEHLAHSLVRLSQFCQLCPDLSVRDALHRRCILYLIGTGISPDPGVGQYKILPDKVFQKKQCCKNRNEHYCRPDDPLQPPLLPAPFIQTSLSRTPSPHILWHCVTPPSSWKLLYRGS